MGAKRRETMAYDGGNQDRQHAKGTGRHVPDGVSDTEEPGSGAGGVDGIFPQHTPEQARKVLEGWFRKKVEGAFSVTMLFPPSMSGPNKNLVLGAT